jgi:hypothetical protein
MLLRSLDTRICAQMALYEAFEYVLGTRMIHYCGDILGASYKPLQDMSPALFSLNLSKSRGKQVSKIDANRSSNSK